MPCLQISPGAKKVQESVTKGMIMKAWRFDDGDPGEACLLVYAQTRNEARILGFRACPWDCKGYKYTRVVRRPKWDDFFDCQTVVSDNKDLPIGAPPFFDNELDWV